MSADVSHEPLLGKGRRTFAPWDAFSRQLASEQQRWFLWLPVAFGAGIALYFYLSPEPSLVASFIPLPVALLLALFFRRGVVSILALSLLIALCAGFAVAKLRTEMLRAPVLQQQLRGALVTGWVELVEPRSKGGQRLTILVQKLQARLRPGRSGRPVRSRRMTRDGVLKSPPYRVRVTTRRADATLLPGDAITIRATLGPPGIPALPGGYDFARFAWFHSLGAVGYSRASAKREVTLGPPPLALRVVASIQGFRQLIGRRIDAALPGEVGAIAKALITGERGGISDATNDEFRASGLFHILSISGLHMAVMAGSIFFLLRLLLAAFPFIALRYPIKKWGAFAAAAGALAYLTISGGTFATVRSYVMISIMFFAILLDRPAVALRNVALAALVILLLYPESLFNVGFQMSFAAVVSLVAAYEAMSDHSARQFALRERGVPIERSGARQVLRGVFLLVGGIILTTLIASAAVAPFAAYHFHQSQHYAVLGNLLAVPLCNIIVMPAALATFIAMPFGLEAGPLWVMGKGIEGMIWCAKFVGGLPGAVGFVPQIPLSAFLLMLAGGLWVTLWRRRWRLLGLLPIAAGLILAPMREPADLLIGAEGELVALRQAGRLHVLPVRGNRYQLSRWLEADGDPRGPDAVKTGRGFRCDGSGCIARAKGSVIAVPVHPSSFPDDCKLADIIISKLKPPSWCGAQRPTGKVLTVIDRAALRRHGTHSLHLGTGGIRIDTVARHRGNRPWVVQRRSR